MNATKITGIISQQNSMAFPIFRIHYGIPSNQIKEQISLQNAKKLTTHQAMLYMISCMKRQDDAHNNLEQNQMPFLKENATICVSSQNQWQFQKMPNHNPYVCALATTSFLPHLILCVHFVSFFLL
jgi:hypothetical protein